MRHDQDSARSFVSGNALRTKMNARIAKMV
jgi:hypothetical protein